MPFPASREGGGGVCVEVIVEHVLQNSLLIDI
jgi:hypothetical protein